MMILNMAAAAVKLGLKTNHNDKKKLTNKRSTQKERTREKTADKQMN